MTDQNFFRAARARWILCICAMLASFVPSIAFAQSLSVPFYVSFDEDGAGGETLYLTNTTGSPNGIMTFPVWLDAGAAGGEGLISVQDVLIRSLDPSSLELVDFACSAPSCRVGTRPEPTREIFFAAGDDTSPEPSLTGRVRIGDLQIASLGGKVDLVAATALRGDGVGDSVDIAALPNEGALIRFLPEPGTVLSFLAGIGMLAWLAKRRTPMA